MFDNRFGHKKSTLYGCGDKMGLSRMLKIALPFIKIFLYVKLVGAHNGYLLELPDIKLPVGQNDPLENKVVTDQNVQLPKVYLPSSNGHFLPIGKSKLSVAKGSQRPFYQKCDAVFIYPNMD